MCCVSSDRSHPTAAMMLQAKDIRRHPQAHRHRHGMALVQGAHPRVPSPLTAARRRDGCTRRPPQHAMLCMPHRATYASDAPHSPCMGGQQHSPAPTDEARGVAATCMRCRPSRMHSGTQGSLRDTEHGNSISAISNHSPGRPLATPPAPPCLTSTSSQTAPKTRSQEHTQRTEASTNRSRGQPQGQKSPQQLRCYSAPHPRPQVCYGAAPPH